MCIAGYRDIIIKTFSKKVYQLYQRVFLRFWWEMSVFTCDEVLGILEISCYNVFICSYLKKE